MMDVMDGAVDEEGWEDIVRVRRRSESSPRKCDRCALERSAISEAVWVSEWRASTWGETFFSLRGEQYREYAYLEL